MKKERGITLVALVITIIILIILAGITLSLVLGNEGLIAKAKKGGNDYKIAAAQEQNTLDSINSQIDGLISGTNKEDTIVGKEYVFASSETQESHIKEFIVPKTGYYKLEVWGAEGGTDGDSCEGGKGGYSSGISNFDKDTKLYIYIGGKGQDRYKPGDSTSCALGGFNGGGNSGTTVYFTGEGYWCDCFGGGGGATDIRTVKASNGNWYDENHEDWNTDSSLLSRIIVAGGGGSAGGPNPVAKAGGGLETDGATQTSGYKLGLGQSGNNGVNAGYCAEGKPGSGGGYYGGTTPNNNDFRYDINGRGGSGYVGSLIQGTTISGSEAIPTYDGNSTMIGNSGDGYAKITYLGENID